MSTEWKGLVWEVEHEAGRCGNCHGERCSREVLCDCCHASRNEQRLRDIDTLVEIASKPKRPPLLVKQVRTVLYLDGGYER